ncbi:hypothetical protein [Yoonia sediminilitoris]|uniref:Uncharacterized protein n=1 Tax=Yoonia sediminilitoris TaxID=1286148 RepID=A0A2T6KFY0_9RHOB|nr:hypothetical protein [Yoonia sediminilitoris]PUB14190.1 hypothetical protein C8N45_10664 [Yoonia sediminilitoris]RCW95121.1 hypothetical protein DFP92_10664 [Yoonia sediminilitoris]
MTPHERAPHHDHDTDDCTGFDYMFPDADGAAYDHTTLGGLDALCAELTPARPRQMPAAMAHIGRFILNDIAQQTATDPEYLRVTGSQVTPRARNRIRHVLVNEKSGRLALDSIYGNPRVTHPALRRFSALLRDSNDPAKMRIGRFTPTEVTATATATALRQKGPHDLVRLHQVMKQGADEAITRKDLLDLPQDARELFIRRDGALNLHRAVIGDSRNDRSPDLSALHLALLSLHNAFVDCYPLPRADNDYAQVHAWARREVRLHYHWLILHDYLPQICDRDVLKRVLDGRATLYRAFRAGCRLAAPEHQPIPLEFKLGIPPALAHLTNTDSQATSRKLDSRTLYQNQRLNLPSAQACIAQLNKTQGTEIPVIAPTDLTAVRTFARQTPLCVYILKEAEILGQGKRLGPLGSTLVAETLVGILSNDHASALLQRGATTGLWHPTDSTAISGVTIESFESLMRVLDLP